jgi:hypothetical protein
VEVHCDEGVAIHIGPAPCAGIREDAGEASAGEHIGQPLSRERHSSRAPTPLTERKATRTDATCERMSGPAWSQTLACVDAPCTGTGRSHVRPLRLDAGGPHREGEEP